ncbi:serine hydrolase domain-containing protein [Arenimonas sp.]|uniref:serine hydrolase domain-containing protein n=1 Tax=Arenimonas sp. TaxID=1872635 RepID=UPI0039E26C1D
MTPYMPLLAMALALPASLAHAMTDTELQAIATKRLAGDRTGACFAVAVVDKTVSRAFVCADPKNARAYDGRTAFEIGSVSKTMTAALLAQQIDAGKMSLDDPLSKYLPAGTKLPEFEGKPILLRHIVTHTSGLPALPAKFRPANPADPYANVTRQDLLDSLADVKLAQAPGERWAYSNYAMMLMTMVLAERSGTDFETLLQRELFAPLGMRDSFIAKSPQGTRTAEGHLPNGKVTSQWNIPVDFAGVGGVRASLDDMVLYLQAEMGERASPLPLAKTQQQILQLGSRRMGMNWMIAPLNGADTIAHEGGTGGFSSFVAFDPAKKRGVVILSDTAMTSVGGLGSLGLHLLDDKVPLGTPRTVVAAPKELLDGLAGDYQLENGMRMQLKGGSGLLLVDVKGQGEIEMRQDSAGDFFPANFDAILRPQKQADGRYGFLWLQGGGAMPAKRVDASAAPKVAALDAAALKAYEGEFRLAPSFAITVFAKDGKLFAQGTGQGALEITYAGKDSFVAEKVGAEMEFQRDGKGVVNLMLLKQGGAVQRAPKQ